MQGKETYLSQQPNVRIVVRKSIPHPRDRTPKLLHPRQRNPIKRRQRRGQERITRDKEIPVVTTPSQEVVSNGT